MTILNRDTTTRTASNENLPHSHFFLEFEVYDLNKLGIIDKVQVYLFLLLILWKIEKLNEKGNKTKD